MSGKKKLSEIKIRIDILLDDIKADIERIDMDTENVKTSVSEIIEIIVISEERAREESV